MGKYFKSNPSSRRLSASAKHRQYEKANSTLQGRTSNWLKAAAGYFGVNTDKDEYTSDYFSKRGRRATELRKTGQSLWKEIQSSSDFDDDTKNKLKSYFEAADTDFGRLESHYSQNPYAVKYSGVSLPDIPDMKDGILKKALSEGAFQPNMKFMPIDGKNNAFSNNETLAEMEGLAAVEAYLQSQDEAFTSPQTAREKAMSLQLEAQHTKNGKNPATGKEIDVDENLRYADYLNKYADNVESRAAQYWQGATYDQKMSMLTGVKTLNRNHYYSTGIHDLEREGENWHYDVNKLQEYYSNVFATSYHRMPKGSSKGKITDTAMWQLELDSNNESDKLIQIYKNTVTSEDFKTWYNNNRYSEGSGGNDEFVTTLAQYFRPDEMLVYKYLREQGGGTYETYKRLLEPVLTQRSQNAVSEDMQPVASESPVMASLASGAMKYVGGYTGITEMLKNTLEGKPTDAGSAGFIGTTSANAVRDTVKEEYASKWFGGEEVPVIGNRGNWIYDTVMSMEDSVISMAFGGALGKAVGGYSASSEAINKIASATTSAVMGSQVASDSFIQGKVEGYTNEKALSLAIIRATVEGLTEKYSVETILNAEGNLLKRVGTSALAEGSEEVASNWLNAVVDVIADGENVITDKLNEYRKKHPNAKNSEALSYAILMAIGEDTSTFLAGAVSGVGMSVFSGGSKKSSELTSTEEKVVGKLYEEALAESQKDGTKLSKSEQKKLYDSIVADMSNGQIKVDDIERILGGDSYKSYQDTVKSENDILSEYEQLGKKQNPTLAETSRYSELKSKVDEINNSSKRGELKSQLRREVQSLVYNDKSGRLVESYREVAKRKENFKADLTQYKGKQLEAVKRAVNSGVLNNTYRSHELVNLLSKIEADKGIAFDYTNNAKIKESGFAVEGKNVTAYKSGNKVTLNIQSSKAWQSAVGHEITHVLEGTDAYDMLRETIYTYAASKGEYESKRAKIATLYKDMDADIDSELTAELVGEYLFGDEEFVKHLTTNRNLFQRIYDEIKYLYKIATGKEQKEIAKSKRMFDKAWKELSSKPTQSEQKNNTAENSGVKYSLNENAKEEVHKALYDKSYKGEVLLRDNTPSIMLAQKGVRDLPMVMKVSHIRENIFSEDEARQQGLKVNKNINYHGLGENLFLNVIDGLDDVTEAYRGTKVADNSSRRENYFLLISKFSDADGNIINVPVYIEETALSNKVFFDTNKISTVYGKERLKEYIQRQIRDKNLVRIKNRSNISSESNAPIAEDYRNTAPKDSISNDSENVKYALSSETDSEYLYAVESGDTETAQRLEDEAADAVTYDNNGNVIPIAERFNEEKTDIRYSVSDKADDIAPVKSYGTPLNELYYDDIAPVRKDIEPARVTAESSNKITPQLDDIAPVRNVSNTQSGQNKNTTDSGVRYSVEDEDKIMEYFEIEKLNDFIYVQNQVYKKLLSEGFFKNGNSVMAKNADSGLIIEINKSGIDETFNKANYQKLSRDMKIAKLLTIRDVVELIESGKMMTYDIGNYHNSKSSVKYDYIENYVEIAGKPRKITIAIRKSPQKNKFWVHQIDIENSTHRPPAGVENSKTGLLTIGAENRISQENDVVKKNTMTAPVQTVEQRVVEKRRALKAELTDNIELRKLAETEYNRQISTLRQQYDSKRNKATKTAYELLQRISRVERLKASADADFAKRIGDLEARIEKMGDPAYSRALYKQVKMKEHAQWAEDLIGDTTTWEDKKLGLQYQTNTERRNLRDIVRDENGKKDIARADAISDALNGQYNREEAAKKREQTKIFKKYAVMNITKAESTYIQMLGEFRYNPESSLTQADVNAFYAKHKKKIDKVKVDRAIEYARKDYDSLISRLNEKLREQGMKEIPYRKGYFPHFTDPKQNFIQKLFNWKTQNTEIPTSIAGLTESFKPVKKYQSFDKRRHTDTTDYNFLLGFDNYLDGALDWIYHLDTLQKRRAVENYIRYTHSDEGIQEKIREVYDNEMLDADEAQAQVDHILAEGKNPLNNFVQDFTTHTNILAGKKNSLDRTIEQSTNRHIYSVMTNVQNRMSANMVLANIRSAITNIIPITQSWAQVSPLRSLQATKDVIANAIKDDGMVDKSDFLTNRLKEPDKLYKTGWDKVLDASGVMFEVVDNFSSQVIWRSKFNQNIANGMTESEAIKNADQFAENVMAGRSKGNEPTLFNAKNPLVKAFTMFQLEVNNQYGYLFKDVPIDLKSETKHWKLNLAKGYTTAFIGAYVYNILMEMITGSDAALDPIGIIEDLIRDLFDDDEEKEPAEVATNFIDNVVEEIPFVGGLFGGGRVPVSSAMPYGDKYDDGLSGFISDVSEGDWKNIGKEMMNPLLNVALPVAGGQIKKTVQGLRMFKTDEEHPVAGSYTDKGQLRFPVEDTPGNRIQAALFGQYASKNAREYFDNGYKPLTDKQLMTYMALDAPIEDFRKYQKEINACKADKDENGETINGSRKTKVIDYINSLDVEPMAKYILIKSEYSSEHSYDEAIINYINNREDLDYEDRIAILKELGFSVDVNMVYTD